MFRQCIPLSSLSFAVFIVLGGPQAHGQTSLYKLVAPRLVCSNVNSVADFSRFPKVSKTAPTTAPDWYEVYLNGVRYRGLITRVSISSWTCPPNGKSREERSEVFYLALYQATMPAPSRLELVYQSTGLYIKYDPSKFELVDGETLDVAQLASMERYMQLIGDNIGVEIKVERPPLEFSIVPGTQGSEIIQGGCIDLTSLQRSAAMIDAREMRTAED